MLTLIPAAMGAAYVARKQYDVVRLNTAKQTLIAKIREELAHSRDTLANFKEHIKCTLDDEIKFKDPYTFLNNPSDLTKFSYALKHNCCGRQIAFYGLLLPFINTIEEIQDIAVIEWLDAHIGYYTEMVNSLYFSAQDISYVKIAKLTEARRACVADKKASADSDITACKDVIEFIEFFLPYYRSMIIKIASAPAEIDEQDELNRKLRILKLTIMRKIDCLKIIFECKNNIKALEDALPTQTADWQKHRTKAALARYRSQLALDSLELYFLLVLKKNFFTNQEHSIELLEKYNLTYERFKAIHETRFPSIFVKGTEILNYEHVIFYIPPELFDEIKSCPSMFDLPIPDFDEIFKYCQTSEQPVVAVAAATTVTAARTRRPGPPLPPRPKKFVPS